MESDHLLFKYMKFFEKMLADPNLTAYLSLLDLKRGAGENLEEIREYLATFAPELLVYEPECVATEIDEPLDNAKPLNRVVLPIIRRVLPTLIAHDIVGVSPMTAPTGPIHQLRVRYADHVIQPADAPALVGQEIQQQTNESTRIVPNTRSISMPPGVYYTDGNSSF